MLTNYIRQLRLFNYDVRMYMITAALIGFNYFGIVSVLLNLYLLRLGYGPGFIGLVNGSTALAFALSSLPSGALGNRFGYRKIVVAGIGLIGAGIGLLPLAELLSDFWRDAGVLMARILGGAGFALYIVNANPYLVVATSTVERDHVFSMQVALLPLAGFIGSLVAGVLPGFFASYLDTTLEQAAPYRYPLLLAALLHLPAVFALLTTREIPRTRNVNRISKNKAPETRDENPSNPHSTESSTPESRQVPVTPYLIIGFLAISALFRMAGEGAARSFFNVYLDTELGVSTARIGLLTAFGQVLAGPTAMAAPFLVMRRGKVPTVVLATLGIAGSLLLMALMPHWVSAGLGFMGVVGMLSITRAVTNVVQMEIVTADWRGTTSGVTSMAMGIGFSSISLGGGYIISRMGFQWLFLLGAVSVTLSALLFWGYFRTPRGEYARETLFDGS
ncbi:MFS transporter [Chloroflexi bacterium TSY]|nr:MFS transporter [Chloroflexi bacterium TSY]